MFLLQADTGDLIDKGLSITPYSMTAYGALVIVLAVAVIYLWRKILSDDKEYKKVLISSTEILTSVKQRLDDQQQIITLINELKSEIVNLKSLISQK